MATIKTTTFSEKPSLAETIRRIHEISSLPHVALMVMEVASQPNAGARELKEVMEVDIALTARVLRCVNSSAYSLRQKITNLQQAISYLGINTIRNLAMTATVSRLFRENHEMGCYRRKGLWRHMVAVGICARLIAMRMRLGQFEDVYLAGLLHDIGIILEDQYAHRGFATVIENMKEGRLLADFEREHLGFDHAALGEEIGRAWKMPNGVTDSIRHHHSITSYAGMYSETLQCVEVGNFLCSLKEMSSVGMNLVAFPRDSILALGLGKTDLVVIAEDLDREINNNQNLFQV
jgi:putative nucleotidyltransferase with HDIG domain